jgi:cytochrome b561
MTRMTRTFVFGVALSVIVAWFLARYNPHALSAYGFRSAIGALICAVAWRLFYRRPQPAPFNIPGVKPYTRKWARILYHNGIISLDELNAAYAIYPEDKKDGDGNGSPND